MVPGTIEKQVEESSSPAFTRPSVVQSLIENGIVETFFRFPVQGPSQGVLVL
jgi:hypothetical protein